MELPDDIYEQIEALSECGNDAADERDFAGAIAQWEQALLLLPAPQVQWEAYTWLKASIGDAQYQSGDSASAQATLFDALNGPDGQGNGFVHYMLGKAMLKLRDAKAADQLLLAYMAEGVDIFDSDEGEGQKCLALLQDRGLVASGEDL